MSNCLYIYGQMKKSFVISLQTSYKSELQAQLNLVVLDQVSFEVVVKLLQEVVYRASWQ